MEATGRQRVFLDRTQKKSDQEYEEWMTRQPGEAESQSEKYASVNSLSAVHKERQDRSRKYIFLSPSEERTECLEAGWIIAWNDTEKYKVTQPGLAQIANGI